MCLCVFVREEREREREREGVESRGDSWVKAYRCNENTDVFILLHIFHTVAIILCSHVCEIIYTYMHLCDVPICVFNAKQDCMWLIYRTQVELYEHHTDSCNECCYRLLQSCSDAHPRTGHEGQEREQSYSGTLSLTSALDGVWVVDGTPWPLHLQERNSVPIVQEAGWAPGPIGTCTRNMAPHKYSVPGPSSP